MWGEGERREGVWGELGREGGSVGREGGSVGRAREGGRKGVWGELGMEGGRECGES